MGSGAEARMAGQGPPQGRRILGAGRVADAHEQHATDPQHGTGRDVQQAVGAERDVSPPPVALGGTAFDQAGAFQNLQVMCQEVPLDTGDPSEFLHSQIAQRQSVHHRQPDRIAQRGVETGAFFQSRHLAQNILIQNLLVQKSGEEVLLHRVSLLWRTSPHIRCEVAW